MVYDPSESSEEMTIPSRLTGTRRPATLLTGTDAHADSAGRAPEHSPRAPRVESARDTSAREAPLPIQLYLQEQIDLDRELLTRFPSMMVMSQMHARQTLQPKRYATAAIATQDGAASLLLDVDIHSAALQLTFVINSMMGFKFSLDKLSQMDRAHWLQTMRRAQTERDFNDVVFLWSAARWNSDYVVFAPRRHHTNLYAFSTHHVDCAARLTTDVTSKLLAWLEPHWTAREDSAAPPQPSSW